jgi:hypothetical protein
MRGRSRSLDRRNATIILRHESARLISGDNIMKRLTLAACSVLILALPRLASGQTPSTMTCAPITQQEIAALFDRWNASLATHDADKVVANYAPDAVLLPTLSNQPRTNSTEIKDYFLHFVERNPQGTIDTRTPGRLQ